MANMHLVTGYAGQEHITAADQGSLHTGIFGSGQFVLGIGNRLAASATDNNTVRVLDGDILMQGRHIRLNEAEYVDLTIENGSQGYYRNDLIVARYTKDVITGVEEVNLVVIKGTNAASNSSDPEYTVGDLITAHDVQNDMPLYRVVMNGLALQEVVPVFTLLSDSLLAELQHLNERVDDKQDTLTGTVDQVVGFNAQGKAIPIAPLAPDATGVDLPASTAAKFGLGSDATVDQALGVLYHPEVGDIILTARHGIGDDWLLCNGEIISESEYPELYNLANSFGLVKIQSLWNEGSTNSGIIFGIKHGGDYWVACGSYSENGTHYARIAYTTELNGTWTTKDLWSVPSNSINADTILRCIEYANGYWVVGGKYYSNSNYYSRIAYTTDLSGTWTTKDIWSYNSNGSSNYNITCIKYEDGYWVVGGQSYENNKWYARIAYSSNPSGTWTTKDLWNGSTAIIWCVERANGYWVVSGKRSENDTKNASIAYTMSLSDSWTVKDVWSTTNKSYSPSINCIAYWNDCWFVCGKNIKNDSNINYASIAYTTDLSGMWTTKDVWSSSGDSEIYTVAFEDDYCAVGGIVKAENGYSARFAHTGDLSGLWTIKDLWSNNSYAQAIRCIKADGGYAIAGGQSGGKIAIFTKKLPEISTEYYAYAFIKAK